MSEKIFSASYAGKQYTQSKSNWIDTLDTNGVTLDRLLAKHGSMQALIDAEYKERAMRQRAVNRFLFNLNKQK